METKTIQQKMQQKLSELPIPAKEILVYGSQIMITCHSLKAAERWAGVLGRFSKVKSVGPSYDYAKENKHSTMNPTRVKVYRVWATIQ